MSALLILAALALAAFALGPRVPADTTIRFDPASIGAHPDAYLARSEAAVPGIRPGLAKEIVWADPATKAKTQVALVYIHGFSASKGELRPLPDELAAALGANLFYTRLAGHGLDGAALAKASMNDWVNDYAEAIAIGRAIGDKVVVAATSNGAALATWGATEPRLARDVAAMVLISPNYRIRGFGDFLLTWPWGGAIADALIGKERGFTPLNPLHARYWTSRYPTRAILPVAALTALARTAPVENVRIPAIFVFSDADQVVRADVTRQVAARWGGPHEILSVEENGDPGSHVIAGDALSPSTTDALADEILVFLRRFVD